MNVFSKLQQDVIARLTTIVLDAPSPVAATGSVQWVTEDIGDLANIVTRAVGKVGIIGIVLTPGGGKMYSVDQKHPMGFVCPIVIQLQENVTVNRGAAGTQIPVLDLVQFCMKRLHNWSPTNQRVNTIYVDETPFVLVSEAPILTYNVAFSTGVTIT